ncbi:unnamed protein product [Heligmosomoides polygyrus]|uniref:TIL domain-containing protein n=1 Tax=Heligmosomoides polygyrus TaxID=6339 RepID=A0A183G8T7_HELPZ|nr:unnamed protein product [Heligmosomoides polygyrus]
MDPSSRCVLPSECERKCSDPLKEFIVCGSSCPVGCDNRRPQSCTPCESGCFCKNGLVFVNSTNWRNSDCVRLDECSDFTPETPESSTPKSATTTSESANAAEKSLVISKLSSKCPATTVDVGGRSCASDEDCPSEQRCCRPVIVSLAMNPQRCTCPDPNAVWTACGTICPEYCGQPGLATANLIPAQKPFGDLSDGCSRLGPPFLFKGGIGTPSLGDVVVDDSSTATFDRVADWPISEVVGRSIAIYRLSTTDYSLQMKDEIPLACGTIGLTAFT